MDRRLAWMALGLGPLLWAACRLLSGAVAPLAAGGLALLLYWAALALGLFALAQAGWLGLRGLDLGLGIGGPAFLLGALALGGAWTAARLESGTLGAGLLAHAGLNLFLFAGIAARAWAPA